MSIGDEASIYARFAFRSHFFQHAGFRMVQSTEVVQDIETTCFKCPGPFAGSWRGTQPASASESTASTAEALDSAMTLLHYGTGAQIVPKGSSIVPDSLFEYPRRLCEIIRQVAQERGIEGAARAIDV